MHDESWNLNGGVVIVAGTERPCKDGTVSQSVCTLHNGVGACERSKLIVMAPDLYRYAYATAVLGWKVYKDGVVWKWEIPSLTSEVWSSMDEVDGIPVISGKLLDRYMEETFVL